MPSYLVLLSRDAFYNRQLHLIGLRFFIRVRQILRFCRFSCFVRTLSFPKKDQSSSERDTGKGTKDATHNRASIGRAVTFALRHNGWRILRGIQLLDTKWRCRSEPRPIRFNGHLLDGKQGRAETRGDFHTFGTRPTVPRIAIVV